MRAFQILQLFSQANRASHREQIAALQLPNRADPKTGRRSTCGKLGPDCLHLTQSLELVFFSNEHHSNISIANIPSVVIALDIDSD